MITVKVVNKSGNKLPEYETNGSAGFDFRANLSRSMSILPGRHSIIPTGLYVEIPEGFEIQVRSRSGLAAKSGIFVLNSPGTIDSDYRGEICIILGNFGDQPFEIKPGDRVAQGVLAKHEKAEFTIVENLDQSNDRGGGLGHTGVE